jgi:hypothetical protein
VFENFVVDRRKVFLDVTLEDVAMGTGKVNESPQGFMSSKSNSIGVRILNEGALKNGDNDVTKGVVDYPISVGSGGDQAAFGVCHVEGSVSPRLVSFVF